MNLTLRQLRYLSEVARAGSIQAAAKSLSISPSSILAAISQAEAEIGARLFVRRPAHGIRITPVGENFVSAARTMLAASSEFERATGNLKSQAPKKIRVGCYEPFGALFLPEMLSNYVRRVGDVEIAVLEGDRPQLEEWLSSGTIDLAILYDIGHPIDHSFVPICKIPAHVMLSSDDPLAARNSIQLSELSKRPLVMLDRPEASVYLLTIFELFATRPEIKFSTRSYETVRAAVSAGFGFSILNMRPVGKATADGAGVVRRPIVDRLPIPTLIAADVYGSNKPMFLRTFIELLRDFFQELGPTGFSVTMPERHDSLFLR